MLYDAHEPRSSRPSFLRFWRSTSQSAVEEVENADCAISIRNLGKDFQQGFLRKRPVTAIENLSLDVPRHGIFVILGSNG